MATKKKAGKKAPVKQSARLAQKLRDEGGDVSWPMALRLIRLLVSENTEWIAKESIDRAIKGDLISLALIAAYTEPFCRARHGRNVRQEIMRRFGHACHHCGRRGTPQRGPDGLYWHLDHLIPLAQNGCDEVVNLVLSCATCNVAKGRQAQYGKSSKTKA